jgi:hypothetical protein
MDHIISEAGDLRRQIAPGPDAAEKRASIRADEMKALRAIADRADHEPLVKQHHLVRAAEFATRHHLTEDLNDIQRELEALSGNPLKA